MAEDELELYELELHTIQRCKHRLQDLFHVTVATSFVTLQNDGTPSKVRLFTSQSQENIEKAKIYLQAVIGTGKDIVRESRQLQTKEFEMVRKNVDQIESLTQVVVSLLRDSHEVQLQGNVRSVQIASDFINMLVQHAKTFAVPVESELKPQSGNDNYGQSQNSVHNSSEDHINLAVDCDHSQIDTVFPATREMSNRISSKSNCSNACYVDSGMCLTERGCSPASSPISDGQLVSSAKACVCKDITDSGNSSRSSSPNSSDHELTVDELLSNPDYTARVERAAKLGYSYDQLVMALRKLGKNADENRLLSELIKMGSSVTKFSDINASENTGERKDHTSTSVLEADVESSVMADESDNLRDIVIDGSNVAMSHGKDVFSCRGIKIAVDWFRLRGHKNITVFVPQWRKESSRPDAPIQDQEILTQLEQERCLSFTPARRVGGRRVVCYDDRYILQLASEVNGIVVSNDNYRDLLNEKPEFKKVIEERLLMYSFAGDRFMPPEDPLGRHGPSLNNFLCKKPTQPEAQPPECPYGKKCTYGNKCRFYHPERRNMPHKSVTEKLQEQAKQKLEERATKIKEAQMEKMLSKNDSAKKATVKKTPLSRTRAIVPPTMSLHLQSGKERESASVEGSEERKPEKKVTDDYNEKLNEHRKKLEKALEQTRKECSVAFEAGRSNDHVTVTCVPSPSGIISPPTKSTNCFPAGVSASGFSSPSGQLKVPTRTRSEELVSGHLLLAKKLSDESVDSKFFTERGTSERYDQSSSPVTFVPMQDPSIIDLSQNLDRQMSLQNKNQGFLQDEVDSDFVQQQHCFSGTPGPPTRLMSCGPGHVDHCQSFPITGRDVQGQKRQSGCLDSHPSLSYMPSAPDGRRLSQSGKRLMAPMERQNSSSDPQVHLTGQDLDYVRYANMGLPLHQTFDRKTFAQPTGRNPLSRSTSVQPQSMGSLGSIGRQISEVCYPHHQVQYEYDLMTPESSSEGMFLNQANWSSSRHHQRLACQQQQERFLQQQAMSSQLQNPSYVTTLPQTHPYQHHLPSHQQLPAQRQQQHAQVPHHQHQQHVLSPQQHMLSPQFPQQCFPVQSQHELPTSRQQPHMTSPQPVMSPLPVLSPESPPKQLPPTSQPRAPDAAIHPTDARYGMYYNLCGLFSEPIVRRVMNEHPDEMDPQEICAYIIGAK